MNEKVKPNNKNTHSVEEFRKIILCQSPLVVAYIKDNRILIEIPQ